MILAYTNRGNVALCKVTTDVFGKDCCPPQPPCDTAVWPHCAYPKLGVPCTGPTERFRPKTVGQWIGKWFPVQAYILWNGGQRSHTILIVGLYANGDLEVRDPDHSRLEGRVSYEHVCNAFNLGSWTKTWSGME